MGAGIISKRLEESKRAVKKLSDQLESLRDERAGVGTNQLPQYDQKIEQLSVQRDQQIDLVLEDLKSQRDSIRQKRRAEMDRSEAHFNERAQKLRSRHQTEMDDVTTDLETPLTEHYEQGEDEP